jgi:signal transduction histidine kinase
MNSPVSILIVDDEPDNFDVIEALLDADGYHLSYVSSGQQALELLQSFQPDLILLDVMMPQMSGIEFCQKFKSHPQWQHIPVIVVTALSTKEDLVKCLEAGADDFLSKPVNRLELRARIRSMLRIKQQYDDLQEILACREDLSSMIVHDLRNPLTTILLAATFLQQADYSPDRQYKKTEQIITAGQTLQSMIDTLLLMEKLESGKMSLQCNMTDLCQLCASAVSDMEAIASQKHLKLITYLSGKTFASIDVNVFRRILDNLLLNAIKFSPSGSEILLKLEAFTIGQIKIQVVDSGPGVKEELRQRIFEKYEIGTLMKGTSQIGLGLAFCKMAIEAHGGQIKVENNEPKGAIFSLELNSVESHIGAVVDQNLR